MRTKIFITALLVICVHFYGNGQTGNTLTLQQVVEAAIKNNFTVKQSELSMERSQVDQRQAIGNMLPDLIGQVSHSANSGRNVDPSTNNYVTQKINGANYGLNSSIVIFNGFQLLNATKQYHLAYAASKMEWQQVKDNVTLNVILAYLQILNNEDLVTQSRNQADLTRKQVERLEEMNRNGAIAPSKLYDLRGQLAGDELLAISNKNALEASKLALAQYMNVPYDSTLKVERLNVDQFSLGYPDGPDKIYQTSLEQLALVKGVELRRESARKEVAAAKGALFPTLSLGGNYSTAYSSTQRDNNSKTIQYFKQLNNNYGFSTNLTLYIPFLNGWRARNQLSRARIDLKSSQNIEENTKIQLKQGIDQAWFNMTAAMNRYKASMDQVNAYSESFRVAEISFNEGVITSVDYLITKNNLDRANINLISARYDYLFRTKILDYYQARSLW